MQMAIFVQTIKHLRGTGQQIIILIQSLRCKPLYHVLRWPLNNNMLPHMAVGLERLTRGGGVLSISWDTPDCGNVWLHKVG